MTVMEPEVQTLGASLAAHAGLTQEERAAATVERLRVRLADRAAVGRIIDAGTAAIAGRGAWPSEDVPVWDRRDDHQSRVSNDAWLNSLRRAGHDEYTRFRLGTSEENIKRDEERHPDVLHISQHPDVLRDWLRRLIEKNLPKPHLIAHGEAGSGKTAALIATGAEAVRLGVMTRYLRHTDFLQWLRPDSAPPGMTAFKVLEFHDSVPLLILDDLCFEMDSYATDHVRTWTGKLLDGRRARGLATLVGTNLSSAAVTEILGARIYSRLAGTALPLEFKHRDRREPISWG